VNRSIMLKHDSPWVVEWKSSGTFFGGAMLMATARIRNIPNSPYLYQAQDSKLLAIGYYTGSSYKNYGICLSNHGIDASQEHTYRLTNKITNGSNMVYLSVDGKELGAMNNYFIGTTSQGTTSNWLSGKNFTFNYFGTNPHDLTSCSIDYIKVWEGGECADIDAEKTAEGVRVALSLPEGVKQEEVSLLVATYDSSDRLIEARLCTAEELAAILAPGGGELALTGWHSCAAFLTDLLSNPLTAAARVE